MQKLGKRQLTLNLQEPLAAIPEALGDWPLALKAKGNQLEYTYDAHDGRPDDISTLLRRLGELGIGFKDLHTKESSLEDIFVDLVHDAAGTGRGAVMSNGTTIESAAAATATASPRSASARSRRSTATASGPSTGSRWPGSAGPCSRAWSPRW